MLVRRSNEVTRHFFYFYPGIITKIFGLSEFALIGNWTVFAFHGHEVILIFNLTVLL